MQNGNRRGGLGKISAAVALSGIVGGCAPMSPHEQMRAEERMLTLGLSALFDAKHKTGGSATLDTARRYHEADSSGNNVNVYIGQDGKRYGIDARGQLYETVDWVSYDEKKGMWVRKSARLPR